MEDTTFRDSILSDLKQCGTPDSLAALEIIADASPELEKRLHWTLIEAKETVQRHTWHPLSPIEFLSLLKRKTTETNLAATTAIMKKL